MADCLLKPTSPELVVQLHEVQKQFTMLKQQSGLFQKFCKLKENFLKKRRRQSQRKGVKFNPRSWRKNRNLMKNHVVLDKKEHWEKYFSLHDRERLLTRCLACCDNPSSYECKFAFADYTKMVRKIRLQFFASINKYFDFHSLKYSALSEDTTNAEFDGCLRVLEDVVKLCEAMTSLINNPSLEAVNHVQKCTDLLLSWAKVQSWRNGCSTSLMFMLHSALYTCPSWKIIDALKRWCKGMHIVSIGSGPGVVELCMKALGWNVHAVDPHDYGEKSLLVTHKQYCQDYKFPTSGLAVLCIFYPGKESFDDVMSEGKCNYLTAVCNSLCNGLKRVIVNHGDSANEFMKAEDKDDMDPKDLCCGTRPLFKFLAGPWWTPNKQSKYPRVTFTVSSFMPEFSKSMSIFDLNEIKRLDALEYLHNEGYIVEEESLIAAAISKIDCLQHQLEQQIEQGRNVRRPLCIEAQAAGLFIQMLEEHMETLQGPESDTIRDSIRSDYDGHIQKTSEKARSCGQELDSIEQVLIYKNKEVLDQISHVLKKYFDVNPDIASSDVSPLDIASSDMSPLDIASSDASPLGIVPSVVSPLDVSSDVFPLDIASLDASPLDIASSDMSPLDIASLDASPLDIASSDVYPLDVSSDASSLDIFRLNHRKKWLFISLKDHHETKNDPETIRNGWVRFVQEDIDKTMHELQKLAEEFVVLNLTI